MVSFPFLTVSVFSLTVSVLRIESLLNEIFLIGLIAFPSLKCCKERRFEKLFCECSWFAFAC